MNNELTCINCTITACDKLGSKFPNFCTSNKIDEETKRESLEAYKEEKNNMYMISAACTEYEGYGKYTRVQETIEFAKKIGAKKIGVATCVGLIRESNALGKLLVNHGFEVYGIACKAGITPKSTLGIPKECSKIGKNICNPILQAKQLNKENTDLNIVMGLCVGHDSLFYKYSEAIVTTLVTKDRVTGHNPVAVLYQLESYYKKLYITKNPDNNKIIKELFTNLDNIKTTDLGVKRIKSNLQLNECDVIQWCKKIIKDKDTIIEVKGKNYYILNNDIKITINTGSFTIITAHRVKPIE